MVKTYVVNLDRDEEKLASVSKRLATLGIEFERYPAVYGKTLSVDEQRNSIDQFRLWCSIGRHLEAGELGCALSHLGIYRKMIEACEPVACVLEDDVVFDDRLPRQISKAVDFLQGKGACVILLSDRTNCGCRDWEMKPSKGDFGTFAYVLNLSAAQALLSANFPVQRPCDHWHVWRSRGVIELYHAFPAVCDYDHGVQSQTAPSHMTKDLPLAAFCLHKVKRLIGRLVDRVLPML